MNDARPLFLLLSPLAGLAVLLFPKRSGLRVFLSAAAALFQALLALWIAPEVLADVVPGFRFEHIGRWTLELRADALALVFISMSSRLWFLTALQESAVLRGKPRAHAAQAVEALALTAASGAALAANMPTLFVFLELLALAAYALIRREDKAAARSFAVNAAMAAVCLAAGILWGERGLASFTGALPKLLFALFVLGLGMKAALFPLGRWLPAAAAAAPLPSSLLACAAALAFMRICSEVFGSVSMRALGLDSALAVLCAFGALAASAAALAEPDLKRRVAHVLSAQLALAVLGGALASPTAAAGGALLLASAGLATAALFFCADSIRIHARKENVAELSGLGRRMPATFAALALAVLSLAGLPPALGFPARMNLAAGAAHSGHEVFLAVLILNALLTLAAFAPAARAAFFEGEEAPRFAEGPWGLWLPAVLAAVLPMILASWPGLFAKFLTLAWAGTTGLR